MHYYIYIADNLPRPRANQGSLIGYRIKNAYVIVLAIFGPVNCDLQSIDDGLGTVGQVTIEQSELDVNGLQLRYLNGLYAVELTLEDHYTVVMFSPPNLRNLEYFTVDPILLHDAVEHQRSSFAGNLCEFGVSATKSCNLYISDEAVLDKINQCLKTRALIESKRKRHARKPSGVGNVFRHGLDLFRIATFNVVHLLVYHILSFLVSIIVLLNKTVYKMKPVEVSLWCKQLDLRLRQITYFPVQFLCYYDPTLLPSTLLNELQLPVPNEKHNINNSNYINLYNLIWLIANDVLLGRAIHSLIVQEKDSIAEFLNDTLLDGLVFGKLDDMISWIGSDHPAGFKLNNELGHFMEAMFLWTLQAWHDVFDGFIAFTESETWFVLVFSLVFTTLSYFGVSFMIAILIDYVNLVTLHIYFFNMATTKIYHRQVEMLKSLTQLFRGRKYNVLRNRIDSLDEDQFRIDQLLLGTFIFMILIYLLPTTFAFYFLFFAARVSILTSVKLGEKFILCFNLFPLFVVLLKLKNSRRLQGGIYFVSKGSHERTSWLRMENKALSWHEIFGNFIFVFPQEGRILRLALDFAEGREMRLRDTAALKLRYLMLPDNYSMLVKVWQSARSNDSNN